MNIVSRVASRVKSFFAVPSQWGSWSWPVRESFTGAWQSNITVESKENLLAFASVFACISLIADDIAKLRIKLMRLEKNGIWKEITDANSPFWPVLRKPNSYQTRVQFLSLWMISKLLYGNTYVLKERDARGVVTAMYVLDSRRVMPLITETGDVYYQLQIDFLSGVEIPTVIPARNIIHDRMLCLWHPLVGVSPLVACGTTATQGLRIQQNSEQFFKNMSRPSGQLTAPGEISDANAKRLKEEFEKNFSGQNIGRLLVTGDGLKYEPMTIPAQQAQLIEQLSWTSKDIAGCFKVPLYKLGLEAPPASSIPVLNQDYYAQTLQVHIEAIEILLDEGLGLITGPPPPYGTELDLDGLLRMDPISRADRDAKEIGSGKLAPNEARKRDNYDPVIGGDSCYLQQQNFSLEALAKRDASPDPFGRVTVQATPAEVINPADTAQPGSPAPAATPAPAALPPPKKDAEEFEVFADRLVSMFREAAVDLELENAD